AHEELVSTDESIRRGKEELDIATAEFGPERTRSFTRAMNHSTTTLQKAFKIRQRLDDSIPETPEQRREMLVEIVSSCGQADDAWMLKPQSSPKCAISCSMLLLSWMSSRNAPLMYVRVCPRQKKHLLPCMRNLMKRCCNRSTTIPSWPQQP